MSQGGHPPAVVPVPADGGAGGAGVEGAAVRPPRALVHARLLVPFRVIKPKDYYDAPHRDSARMGNTSKGHSSNFMSEAGRMMIRDVRSQGNLTNE